MLPKKCFPGLSFLSRRKSRTTQKAPSAQAGTHDGGAPEDASGQGSISVFPVPPPMTKDDTEHGQKLADGVYLLYESQILKEPCVDILLCHGLQLGSYEEAWWKAWQNRHDISWVAAWLGPDLEAEGLSVRVFSLSYDSAAVSTAFKKQQTLLDAADMLLHNLACAKVGQRGPLLLVVHSLGGLMAQQLLITAQQQVGLGRALPEVQTFLKNFGGTFYFSTPHGGATAATVADFLAKPVSWLLTPSVEILMHASSARSRIVGDFNHLHYHDFFGKGRPWKTAGVVETEKTRGIRVVSYADANFGLDEGLLPVLGADHISICKPVAKTDTAYLAVKSFIQRTVAQIPAPSPIRVHSMYPEFLLTSKEPGQYWQDYWHPSTVLAASSASRQDLVSDAERNKLSSQIGQSPSDTDNQVLCFMQKYQCKLLDIVGQFPNAHQQRSIFELMLKASEGEVKYDSETNRSLLHYLAMNGAAVLLEPLVKAGSAVDARDSDHRTPLHLAVIGCHDEAVEALLVCGADACKRDLNNALPWHLAVAIDMTNAVHNDDRAKFKQTILRLLAPVTNLADVNTPYPCRILKALKENPTAYIQHI
ncbi:TPA: Serine active site containing protein 1, variant 3 [Trebouxia sp. C0004]